MPGVYKEKECPECGVLHRKRGIHCSQRCAQVGKTLSQDQKDKIGTKSHEYRQSPEGIASTSMLIRKRERFLSNQIKEKNGEYILTDDDWMVDIPSFSEDDDISL